MTGKTEWDAQLEVFRVQWEVATQLDRPVSVHCVRAHGFLYDWLRGEPGAPSTHPPAISLHSYTGSADMVRAFTRYAHRRRYDHGTAALGEWWFIAWHD
jgi:Tat protein secretion system quality control protein TatD with DNase activity